MVTKPLMIQCDYSHCIEKRFTKVMDETRKQHKNIGTHKPSYKRK